MFGRKKSSDDVLVANPPAPPVLKPVAEKPDTPEIGEDDLPPMPAHLEFKRNGSITLQEIKMSDTDTQAAPVTTYRPEIPRRPVAEIPPVGRSGSAAPSSAASTGAAPRTDAPDPKVLIVGREISLNGQITSCDKLIVEGKVEATLTDSRFVEIAESGTFKGSADIEEAEIRGRFDGKISVRGRLLIRGTGRVTGEIRYGQLEIECGGQISGTIETTSNS